MTILPLHVFLLLFLGIGISIGQGEECADFTLSECTLNEDSLIDEIGIPGTPGAFQVCQELCQIEDECNYFVYNRPDENCRYEWTRQIRVTICIILKLRIVLDNVLDSFPRRLYHLFDISTCARSSGPASPEFYSCLPAPGSHDCSDFIELECTTSGAILLDTELTYATECQDFLLAIGESIGADYFDFDGEAMTCKLLDSRDRTCQEVSGPDFPAWDSCESGSGTTTTTTITTTGTGESTTTTAIETTTTTELPETSTPPIVYGRQLTSTELKCLVDIVK